MAGPVKSILDYRDLDAGAIGSFRNTDVGTLVFPAEVENPFQIVLMSSFVLTSRWTRIRPTWKLEYSTKSEKPEQPIGRYPVPYKKDLPYDIVELMEEVETKSGFLPNIFKVLSYRPIEFRVFFAYYNALMNKET
eukprot:g36575.t1